MRFAVRPVGTLGGSVSVPGDKSIAHRWLILAATARGGSVIRGLPNAHDVRSTAACLTRISSQAGVERWLRGGARRGVRLTGRGWDGLRQPPLPLDCGNSGTTMRLLAGALAGRPFSCVLDGDDSLLRRPMERVAEPLRAMGAEIETEDGHGPLTVRGDSLTAVAHRLPVPSAQVKGALLLAGMQAKGTTRVDLPGPSRDHTERALLALGAPVRAGETRVELDGPFQHRGFRARVPGDASSAAFALCAAALFPGSAVAIRGVSVNPTRLAYLEVLRRAGAEVVVREERVELGEPVGAIELRAGPLRPFTVTADEMPTVIDEVPALAAVAAHAPGASRFEGSAELRVKESDRVEGIALGLRALGGEVHEEEDGFVVQGGGLEGGEADAQGDHRLAMALAIAGLAARAPSSVDGAEVAWISFPGFAQVMASLGADIQEVEE